MSSRAVAGTVIVAIFGSVPPPETRPAELLAEWRERDPLARFEADLQAQGIATDADLARIRDQVQRDLAEAVAFAEASPFPDPKDLLVDMFAE